MTEFGFEVMSIDYYIYQSIATYSFACIIIFLSCLYSFSFQQFLLLFKLYVKLFQQACVKENSIRCWPVYI